MEAVNVDYIRKGTCNTTAGQGAVVVVGPEGLKQTTDRDQVNLQRVPSFVRTGSAASGGRPSPRDIHERQRTIY